MRSLSLGLLLCCCACGSGEDDIPVAPGSQTKDSGVDSTPKSGAGAGSGKDAAVYGMKNDAGAMETGGPTVTIVSPAEALDPNKDEILTEPIVKVSCRVERSKEDGAAAVDKSSVRIRLRNPEDSEAVIEPPVNALPADMYEATFELTGFPNTPLHFSCSGNDLSQTPKTGTATLETFVDLGPSVEIISPNAPIYALKTPVPIEFSVQGYPVSDADKEHMVAEIKLLVAGVETAYEESTDTPGLYQASVDFDDRLQFSVPPSAAQIVVTATDARSPKAATRNVKADIAIDGDGPTIAVLAPRDGEIVHGERVLEVNVQDVSGIRASSLVADFNQGLYTIREWEGTGPAFRQRFDTRTFGSELTRLTLAVSATDAVGNETTVAHTLKLDNLPPVISLTPPEIREWRGGGVPGECSTLFDPVGDDVPNDGESATNLVYLRALVEDRTNQPIVGEGTSPVTYLAGVNASSVEVYMQRDPSVPLLIDTDGDNICDEINYEALDMNQRPAKLALAAVNPVGTAWYRKFDTLNPDNVSCYAAGGDPNPPTTVCSNSPMFRVVPGRAQGRPPAVYAIRPSNDANNGECTGEYWELKGIAMDGWICLASRVEDNIGNIGVSDPVRVCFEETAQKPPPTPDCSGAPMPGCTDGCTISEAQRFQYSDFNQSWYFP